MGYITGALIKELREKKKMTQKELAQQLAVSDKTISKWETGRGLPDIGIVESLAQALGVSVTELFTGEYQNNENRAANLEKVHFYVCPICGNVLFSVGAACVSCCGLQLSDLCVEEDGQGAHDIQVETVDDEYHVFLEHEMTRRHYISFVAYVTTDGVSLQKQYPEQTVSVRFRKNGRGYLYAYCNLHGLFRLRV